MSWSFALFVVGLAILITIQALLVWCSHLENYAFSTPRLWEFFLGIGVYGACAAVVTAITILVVTVLNLEFNVGAGGDYSNPNASLWDAPLIFDVPPRSAAIVAFAVSGLLSCLNFFASVTHDVSSVHRCRCHFGYPCFCLVLHLQVSETPTMASQHRAQQETSHQSE